MSLTLGEKLQQAREARGITLSEVAEQTRIAPLYLECIENNDYRTLPGGIFNKGFVKSYARYVGMDEQEALQDYAALPVNQNNQTDDNPKTYRPEVLTDDRMRSSMLPTLVFAVIILGLMTWGILTLVNYIQQNQAQTAAANANANSANANSASTGATATNTNPVALQNAPAFGEAKIEFKPSTQAVWLVSVTDGVKKSALVNSEKPAMFEPKQNLSLAYAKEQAQNAGLTINGKAIKLPQAPDNAKRNVIEFEITKENFGKIWESAAIASGIAAQTSATPKSATR